MNLISGWES